MTDLPSTESVSADVKGEIVAALHSVKAIEVVEFYFPADSRLFDYCLICSGSSRAHVRGIADKVEEELKKKQVVPLGVEGRIEQSWILMDYNTVVVHIFLDELRSLYNIEELYDQWQKKITTLNEED